MLISPHVALVSLARRGGMLHYQAELANAFAPLTRTSALAPAVNGDPPTRRTSAWKAVPDAPGLERNLAWALPVLGLVLAWDVFLLMAAPTWLSGWLPPGVAATVVAAYVLGSLGWIGLTYASLPLVAHRRTLRSPAA
ncbi:MAG: hypothetical protein ABFS41_10595 [Myxococcota bacterium]